MCPTSNVHTGAASSIADHPIGLLARLRFRVTVNTDNRLMSRLLDDQRAAHARADLRVRLGRLALVHVNAMKSAFIHFDDRLALIDDVIKPGYAALTA